MAKVGIMTFLHNENCGSSLQAFALQRTLKSLGYEPLGLDYRPDRAEQLRNLLRSGNSPAVVLDSMANVAMFLRRSALGECHAINPILSLDDLAIVTSVAPYAELLRMLVLRQFHSLDHSYETITVAEFVLTGCRA